MLSVIFAVLAALSATSAAGVVLNRRPLYSALSLVVNMMSLALLFLLLSAQFLAAVQVIVYAGAVMVLFVFVIALLNPARDPTLTRPRDPVQTGAVVALAGGLTLLSAVGFLNFGGTGGQTFALQADNALGTIQAVGQSLYNEFGYPFEVTTLILVVAAVGAVYLSRGK
ncbi:MAG TPA: NADH-quinone oxidoreductase subunit J [Candidatus Dormibacteraeota bacterium]|nr:NADH-quinone oxidoreductase subunit J [Candidatus Dormibacteraeota bacterium]